MKAGDVFHLDDWAGGHINFVLEIFSDESLITCNFTDCSRGSDTTCIVFPGEHPNITKKSVVNFAKAHHCESSDAVGALERLIGKNYKLPLSSELLARIRQGALDSPRTPTVIKETLQPKSK